MGISNIFHKMKSRRSSVTSITSFKNFSVRLSTGIRNSIQSVRSSVCSSSSSPTTPLIDCLPHDLVCLHREVSEWSKETLLSQCYNGKSWKIPATLDGHEFCFLMNMSLNGRSTQWQTIYSVASHSVFIRLLKPSEISARKIIPEVKVVGQVKYIV